MHATSQWSLRRYTGSRSFQGWLVVGDDISADQRKQPYRYQKTIIGTSSFVIGDTGDLVVNVFAPAGSRQGHVRVSCMVSIGIRTTVSSVVVSYCIMSNETTKVAVVVGYGPGLGAALAHKWSREGFAVALLSRNLEKVEAAAATLNTSSRGYRCDVTEPDSIVVALAAVVRDLGPIDCLLYNVGVGVFTPWQELAVADFDASFRLNASGLLVAAQQVVPIMLERLQQEPKKKQHPPSILITGATASLRGKPFTVGFAPSKGAQRLLAQALARDLGPQGIHVAYFIIDGVIGATDLTHMKADGTNRIQPDHIADTYWHVAHQPSSCWSFETDVRPSADNW